MAVEQPVLYPIPEPTPEQFPELNVRDQMPWRGVKVLILKKGHQLRTKAAIVRSILRNQNTPSGLKVEVHALDYDPNIPFGKALFDYDDVVEFVYVISINVRPLTITITT